MGKGSEGQGKTLAKVEAKVEAKRDVFKSEANVYYVQKKNKEEEGSKIQSEVNG